MPYHVTCSSPVAQGRILHTAPTLAAGRKWAKTEGRAMCSPGDRLEVCRVMSAWDAEPGLVNLEEVDLSDEPEPEPATPEAQA